MLIFYIMDNADIKIFEYVVHYIRSRDIDQLGELTVTRLARELNIGRTYLYKTFSSCRQMSPADFLRLIKLSRAAELLGKGSDLPIKKIAERLGFGTTDYFIRLFKTHIGTTPFQYRKCC